VHHGFANVVARLRSSRATAIRWEWNLCTHRLPLDEAPHGYEVFQKKEDGAIKVMLEP
jgi:threonine dehydrogenase-like Zn-dependent dehydrogenase